MVFHALALTVAIVHLLFVAYVVVGGFLAWRVPWTIAIHVPAVLWGFGGVIFGYECPLTHLESWAREKAGESRLPQSGFIDHYLTGVLYPEDALGLVRSLVAAAVIASWIGFVALLVSRRRRRSTPPRPLVSGTTPEL